MNKYFSLFVIFFSIVIFSCSSNNESETIESNAYFDFDEIVHVRILISDEDYNTLFLNQSKTENEEKLFKILTKTLNKDLSENTIVKDLEGFNKIENTINKKYYEDLNTSVFVEKPCDDYAPPVCDPFFRDVLIFKKNGAISGIGKFSFNCRISDFSGTSSNFECFGSFGEFEKLRKILNENSTP